MSFKTNNAHILQQALTQYISFFKNLKGLLLSKFSDFLHKIKDTVRIKLNLFKNLCVYNYKLLETEDFFLVSIFSYLQLFGMFY